MSHPRSVSRGNGDFLTPHFVLALIVVLGWMAALAGPLGGINDLFGSLGSPDASDKLTKGIQSVLAVSGLFSPVVGAVFGYYFGAAGAKQAERRADLLLAAEREARRESSR